MLKDILYDVLRYIKTNTGKTIGTLVGLLSAILILTIGFFKTLLILILSTSGYIIGKKIDRGEDVIDSLMNRIIDIKKRF
ncbi:MAG TPA: DUF2273 domain-containing protein [Tissierellia bacterium]|nr:DUF2273 domain-containing protein [Tissierellia bacterium]